MSSKISGPPLPGSSSKSLVQPTQAWFQPWPHGHGGGSALFFPASERVIEQCPGQSVLQTFFFLTRIFGRVIPQFDFWVPLWEGQGQGCTVSRRVSGPEGGSGPPSHPHLPRGIRTEPRGVSQNLPLKIFSSGTLRRNFLHCLTDKHFFFAKMAFSAVWGVEKFRPVQSAGPKIGQRHC